MEISTDRAKILIVDDEPRFIQSLVQLFQEEYEVLFTLVSTRALELVASEQPHLILLDLMMPGMDGYHFIRKIKQNQDIADIPIIVVTGQSNTSDETESLSLGAVDYITKPFNPEIVKARVRTHIELKRRGDLLKALSYQDGLTGILNRRCFDEILEREYRRCKRSQSALSLLMIDVDHFKAYNDIYGHLAGDDCLKHIVLTMKKRIKRSTDLLARYGGEEFACVLPETNFADAKALAEILQGAILDLKIPHKGGIKGQVTISIGLAMGYPHEHHETNYLLNIADQCLYKAKANGRSTIRGFSCMTKTEDHHPVSGSANDW